MKVNTSLTNYSLEEAVKLISDIGGYDPETEAQDLLDKAKSDDEFNKYLASRINDHEPVAYITNHARFRGLDLFIDDRVLIPRHETEPLVEIVVDEASTGQSIIDVGTGSGAVALAVKNERPDLKVLGLDISKDALDVAAINARTLELDISLKEADLIEGVKGEFQVILANLPYLPTNKRNSYAPEMTEHEPQVALWGGEDGYALIRRLLAGASARKGIELIALETAADQAPEVAELVRTAGFPVVFGTKDRNGDTRCICGKR